MLSSHFEQMLRCPSCRGRLRYDDPGIVCVECEQRYPVHLDIPDLRWPRPPGKEVSDLALGLIERYYSSSFADLVTFEIESLSATGQLKQTYFTYRLAAVERGTRLERMFRECLDRHFQVPGNAAAFSIGCGSGASLPSMAEDFACVCGVDPFLPDLVLARKLCEELGLDNVLLAQAVGQHLPLHTEVFDYASAQNVIEHLVDVESVLHEVRRVLKPMGCFCADSRNRFDLFRPEPHVDLRWVGFWPRRLMSWYVRRFRGMDYKGIHLLSLRDLRYVLRRSFGERWLVTLPDPTAYCYSAQWDRAFARFRDYPLLHTLSLQFFPSHLALAQAL